MYKFESKVKYDTVIVDVFYNGNKVGVKKFSTLIQSEESAINFLENNTKNFGFSNSVSIGGDGSYYPPPENEDDGPDITPTGLGNTCDSIISNTTETQKAIITSPSILKTIIEESVAKPIRENENAVIATIIQNQSSNIPDERISDDSAKMMAKSFPKNHPIRTWLKDMTKELIETAEQLDIKGAELLVATTQLTIETVSALITIGSSAMILPFGAGVPTAFSAVLGIFSNLEAYQTKVSLIIPLLKPLKNIDILVPSVGDAVAGALSPIKTALDLASSIIGSVTKVKNLLPSVPGIGDTPPNKIDAEIWGTKTTLTHEQIATGGEDGKVYISINATGGRWDYIYWWTSDKDTGTLGADNSINVWPTSTTKYAVSIRNKEEPYDEIWRNWTVVVPNAGGPTAVGTGIGSGDGHGIDIGDGIIEPPPLPPTPEPPPEPPPEPEPPPPRPGSGGGF